jgi:branched-chain amino acid transport system substrate-binding protein
MFAVAAGLSLSACGGKEESAGSAAGSSTGDGQVRVGIGHAAPLTGAVAHLGKDNESGVELAVLEANARGLTIGGRKVVFEMMSEDDEGKPDKGPIVGQKFVDAGVAGVVGHLNSGVAIPASSIYQEAGIPVISGSATNPQLTEQGFQVTFRTVGRDDQQGPAVADYLIARYQPKLAAVIDDASSYGEGLANEVEKTLKAKGVTVLAREKGTDKQTDWKAVLTKLRGRKPDAVFFGGMDATAGPLLKQARELGLTAVFAFGDGACTDKMHELAGAASEGLVCSQAGIPVSSSSRSFLDAYKAKYGKEPLIYAPFTYDATNVLIEAMIAADSVDPAKFLPSLKRIAHVGATGRIEFDDKGDRKDAEMTIFTVQAGKVLPVAIVKSAKIIDYKDFAGATGAGDR